MTEINLTKLSEFMAANGADLTDHPELAAQAMELNERLATLPEDGVALLNDMMARLLTAGSSAPTDVVDES